MIEYIQIGLIGLSILHGLIGIFHPDDGDRRHSQILAFLSIITARLLSA